MKSFVTADAAHGTIRAADVDIPRIGEDEVLVRVQAVGVGIHDSYFLPDDACDPYPIGIEAAGVIERVGETVSGRHLGDRVAFVSSMQPKGGTWAEYVAVKANSLIVEVPNGMGFVDAAALPVAGNTALRALRGLGAAPTDGSLFVAGGSGAIGTLAIQIARQRGWRVAASASEANQEYMRSLGAEMTVDYRDPQWADRIRQWIPGGVNAAIAVQPATTSDSMSVVQNGGHVITISGDSVEPERDVHVEMVSHLYDVSAELAQLLDDVNQKKLRVEIEQVFPFEEAPAALAKVQTRHARGKLVLTF